MAPETLHPARGPGLFLGELSGPSNSDPKPLGKLACKPRTTAFLNPNVSALQEYERAGNEGRSRSAMAGAGCACDAERLYDARFKLGPFREEAHRQAYNNYNDNQLNP